MTKPDDGGPAFPQWGVGGPNGMSLRDWFAGQTLAGQAGASAAHAFTVARRGANPQEGLDAEVRFWAKAAYAIADAMLAARKP